MRFSGPTVALALVAGLLSASAQTLPSAPLPVLTAPMTPGLGESAPQTAQEASPAPPSPVMTMFPHSVTARYWISGQVNVISQVQPGFHSPYQGPHSLDPSPEAATSLLDTLFLGWQVNPKPRFETDALVDFEETAGGAIGNVLGLAGFTDLDVVRSSSLSKAPYLARAEILQTLGLTSRLVPADRGPFSLASEVPARRIVVRIGKFALPDIFDTNSVASDSYHQFMNGTVDNDGAWDYAADTRGYTVGGAIEFDSANWALRYGIFAMPTAANGGTLDWAFSRARGQNWEVDWNHSLLRGRTGTIRLLAYENNGDMGYYRVAVEHYLDGLTPTPEITSVQRLDTPKYGFGWNSEQEITSNLSLATRFGWNDDEEESFCYTEVGQTVEVAGEYTGARWHRPGDKAGVAFVSNAIKKDHQNYLKYGGLGFLLGDGTLSYGRENIVETYYTWHTWRGLFLALDGQHIDDPGYNRARGPVWVFSAREHVDF